MNNAGYAHKKRPAPRRLAHLTKRGSPQMINVGAKPVTVRMARAEAWIYMGRAMARTLRRAGGLAKGNVIETARLSGIMAAKRTASLIPMCHPLPLDFVSVDTEWRGNRLRIETAARAEARTGVEMEALVAASVAALTVYDMCKSADKGIVIQTVRLLEKSGGKSGHWRRKRAKGQGREERGKWRVARGKNQRTSDKGQGGAR